MIVPTLISSRLDYSSLLVETNLPRLVFSLCSEVRPAEELTELPSSVFGQ